MMMSSKTLLALGMAVASGAAWAVRPTTIYFVQHTHSDIGYARPQSKIISHYVEHIDHALDYCELTADYPKDAQFHWTCETTAAVLNFLRIRSPEEIARLRHWVEKGNIEVTGMFLNMGEMGDEATMRHGLRELRQVHAAGIPVKTIMQSDVHGIPWFYADLCPELGVKYTWMAENTDRALKPFSTPTVYRWQSPSGNEMLAFRSEHYMTGNGWGLTSGNEEHFTRCMNAMLDRLDKAGYPFDAIAIPYCGFPRDDAPPTWFSSDFIRKWNASGKHKERLVNATVSMFMDHVARDTAGVAKTGIHRAAYPDWWADGFGTSAHETGEAIRAQRELNAAEGVFAQSLLRGRSLPATIAPLLADTRENLLYWVEHTMGSETSILDPLRDDVIEGWRSKQGFAWTAQRGARFAGEAATGLLQLDLPRDSANASLTLYNSLPWTRDGFAEVFIDFGVVPRGSEVRFVDEKGNALAARRTREAILRRYTRTEGAYYRVFARDLPPCGSRTYRMEVGGTYAENSEPATLENAYYRLAVDATNGVITSIFDKRNQKELVDAKAPYRLGEIIYEKGPNHSWLRRVMKYDPKMLQYGRCTNFKVAGHEQNDLYDSVKFTADFPEEGSSGFSFEIRLLKNRPAIELAYTLRRTHSGDTACGFYVAFPFTGKKIAYDVQGGLVHPGENQLEGTATAWNAIQNFAAAEDGDFRILLSSPTIPLAQFGKLNGNDRFEYIKKYEHPHIFSWPMNNYWWTNFVRDQNGDFAWSYTLTTQLGKGAEGAFRWALAEQVPLLPHVTPRGPFRAGAREWKGLELANPALVATSLAPALDGKGVVMLVGERAGRATTLEVKGHDGKALRLRRIDAMERSLGDFATTLPVKPLENLMVYIEVGGEGKRGGLIEAALPAGAESGRARTPAAPQLDAAPYRFIRFKPEALKGDTLADWHGVQLAEIELFENGKNLRGEIVRVFADEQVLTPDGRKYDPKTVPAMAFDGDIETKWFDYRGGAGKPAAVREAAWVAVELKRPVKLTGYAWSTADDHPDRDPATWRLQGSNDGKAWTDIHVVRGFSATGMRNAPAYRFQ